MTLSEVIEDVAAESGYPKTHVAKILASFFDKVTEVTATGESVTLTRFGTFYTVEKTAKPLFGGIYQEKPGRSVRFRLSDTRKKE